MVDRATKYLYIILIKEYYLAEQLGYIVLDRLIRYYKILEGFVSDRNKLVTLNYWKILISLLGTKLKYLIVFHLTTDS